MQGILIQKNITSSVTSPVLEETIKMSLKLWFLMVCYVLLYISLLCSIETLIASLLFTTVMIFINVENISLNSSSFKICSFSHSLAVVLQSVSLIRAHKKSLNASGLDFAVSPDNDVMLMSVLTLVIMTKLTPRSPEPSRSQ